MRAVPGVLHSSGIGGAFLWCGHRSLGLSVNDMV